MKREITTTAGPISDAMKMAHRTPVMPARIAEPFHDATLAEVREVWLPRLDDADVLAAACSTGLVTDGVRDAVESSMIAACDVLARRWMETHGLDMGSDDQVVAFIDADRVGVRFTMIIGRASGRSGAYRQDAWYWSARWTYWADVLMGLVRNNATPAHRAGVASGDVIDLDSRRLAAALGITNMEDE